MRGSCAGVPALGAQAREQKPVPGDREPGRPLDLRPRVLDRAPRDGRDHAARVAPDVLVMAVHGLEASLPVAEFDARDEPLALPEREGAEDGGEVSADVLGAQLREDVLDRPVVPGAAGQHLADGVADVAGSCHGRLAYEIYNLLAKYG